MGKPQKADTAAHEQRETITEIVEYPEHVQRTESATFKANKRLMVRQLDLPCWVCGTRENREIHHIHEWALWADLDPDKVLDSLHAFDPYGFTKADPETPVASADDKRNLLCLCAEHHRAVEAGIHRLTGEIWIAQRAAKPGVSITHPTGKASK